MINLFNSYLIWILNIFDWTYIVAQVWRKIDYLRRSLTWLPIWWLLHEWVTLRGLSILSHFFHHYLSYRWESVRVLILSTYRQRASFDLIVHWFKRSCWLWVIILFNRLKIIHNLDYFFLSVAIHSVSLIIKLIISLRCEFELI